MGGQIPSGTYKLFDLCVHALRGIVSQVSYCLIVNYPIPSILHLTINDVPVMPR